MPVFEPNQPIVTKEPFIVVENKFQPGRYVFRLVVRRGREESQPAETVVRVGEDRDAAVPPPPTPPSAQPAPRRRRSPGRTGGRQRKKS